MKLELLQELVEDRDSLVLNLPLFIRLLEWSREDAAEDVDLHVLAENAINLMKSKAQLSMNDYDALLKNTGDKHATQ